jgi:hypothetical protein
MTIRPDHPAEREQLWRAHEALRRFEYRATL